MSDWSAAILLVACLMLGGCFSKTESDPGAKHSTQADSPLGLSAAFERTEATMPPGASKEEVGQGDVIYQAAVPELPEFDWKLTRTFNLPLNNPPHVRPAQAEFLRADDIVLGVVLEGEARAYPWNLMANFHAANDTLNGQPIIVNLCEACNGGAAFLATLPETVIDMRPRGLKNGTWYGIDFQTGSLWYPFIGEAFDGPLKGTKLTRIRAYFSSWRDWVREHPNTTVAVTSDEVRMRPHGRASKMAAEKTFNPAFLSRITDPKSNPKRALLPGHTLVFGLIPATPEAKPKAVTIEAMGASKLLIQATLDGVPMLLLLRNEYQVGAYQPVIDGVELKMEIESENPLVMSDQKGNKWSMWGRTLSGPDHPHELALVDGYLAKWYEWVENFPDTQLLSPAAK